jgi:hypothetical protein
MKNALVLTFALAAATMTFGQTANQPQAEKLSKQQLQTLIATAKTPAQHERIARYYEAKAQSDLVQAKEHAQMAAEFKQNNVTSSAKYANGTVNHCEYLAASLKKDAAKMEALAQDHEQMAERAGQM